MEDNGHNRLCLIVCFLYCGLSIWVLIYFYNTNNYPVIGMVSFFLFFISIIILKKAYKNIRKNEYSVFELLKKCYVFDERHNFVFPWLTTHIFSGDYNEVQVEITDNGGTEITLGDFGVKIWAEVGYKVSNPEKFVSEFVKGKVADKAAIKRRLSMLFMQKLRGFFIETFLDDLPKNVKQLNLACVLAQSFDVKECDYAKLDSWQKFQDKNGIKLTDFTLYDFKFTGVTPFWASRLENLNGMFEVLIAERKNANFNKPPSKGEKRDPVEEARKEKEGKMNMGKMNIEMEHEKIRQYDETLDNEAIKDGKLLWKEKWDTPGAQEWLKERREQNKHIIINMKLRSKVI